MQCMQCSKGFEVTDQDRAFYKRFDVPDPTLCTLCREQRRICWRNERNLYKRPCNLCKREHVSIYSPDKKFNVLCQSCWWSDKWDGLSFGRDFDFSRSFFDQFKELLSVGGVISAFGTRNENSEFVNQETDDKNCYLNAGGHYNEDCYYCTYSIYGKNNADCYWVLHCELCYDCVYSSHCYNSVGLKNCEGCTDCYFSEECTGCENCFGCYGLKHKKYHLFNKELSPENYKTRMAAIKGSYQNFKIAKEKAYRHFLKYPHKHAQILNCQDSTGDYLKNCKNVEEGYLFEDAEDCKRVYIGLKLKDCMDLSSYGWGEVLYECASSIELNTTAFATSNINVNDSFYTFVCQNSDHLFGCVGLERQNYCILNKKYSRGEYEKLIPKIIEHTRKTNEWGEFFPHHLSPFGYNETVAHEYFPLEREEVLKRGWNWKEESSKDFQKQAYVIPDNIRDVQDDIADAVLACEVTGRNFRIIPQELRFYRNQGIPIPRRHPQTRHLNRLALQNPFQLWPRKCGQCDQAILTAYSPDRPEMIYCEPCFLKEIY